MSLSVIQHYVFDQFDCVNANGSEKTQLPLNAE